MSRSKRSAKKPARKQSTAKKRIMPRYPIYVPSKGRAEKCRTAQTFARDGVAFRLVVEPQESAAYAKLWGRERLLLLPENDRGLVYARNWIKEHAVRSGAERHWQFDDDVSYMVRLHRGYRIPCATNVALAVAEDFVDRYENVALASFNSQFFIVASAGTAMRDWPPFYLNSRCYTNFLMMNALPNRWRHRYNEDTDMTLQVLADGWCTILFNAFMIVTPETMTAAGGQMASASGSYQGDGRLRMARELERVWPGTVTTYRRFGRPQHYVKDHWKRFDTPLRLKPGARRDAEPKDYGMRLRQKQEVESADLRKLLQDVNAPKE